VKNDGEMCPNWCEQRGKLPPMAAIEHQATFKSKTCLETIGVFLYDGGQFARDGHGLSHMGNVK